MKTCKQCGQVVPDNETYCPRCGSGHLEPDKKQAVIQKPVENTPKKPIEDINSGQKQAQKKKFSLPGKKNKDIDTEKGKKAELIQPQQAPPGFANPNAVRNKADTLNIQIQKAPSTPNSELEQDIQQDTPEEKGNKLRLRNKQGEKKKKEKPEKQKKTKQPKVKQSLDTGVNQEDIGKKPSGYEEVSLLEWVCILIQLLIPVYNIIYIIIKLRDSNVSTTIKNYIKASCIVAVTLILILAIALKLVSMLM